jgi:hypothetical protein
MAKGKENYSDEKVYDDDLNQISQNANDRGGFRDDINGGEPINGASTPVAAYISEADGELYACDGNDPNKINFAGFVTSDTTDGNPANFQGNGIVRGFTGLTPGALYYAQDDKTIGTTPGTYKVIIGRAITATELLIVKELPTEHYASDTLRHSNDAEKTTSATSYTKIKEIVINKAYDKLRVKFNAYRSGGSYSTTAQIYKNGVALGTEQTLGDTTTVYSEDLGPFVAGDLLQIYAQSQGGTAHALNFRIYYDEKIIPIVNFTSQDPA